MIAAGDILAVLVCYKTDYRESSSWKSLQATPWGNQMHWFIYDNSSLPVSHDSGILYEHHPENPGVSAAYLQAAKVAAERQLSWLFLLDQDSIFPANWFDAYQKAIQEHPEQKLFVPQIPAAKGWLSPSRYWLGRSWIAKNLPPSLFRLDKYVPINAGMLVELEAYQKSGGHCAAVQLDFSDLAFLYKFRQHYPSAILCNFKLKHQLSGTEKASLGVRLNRFQQYCRDATGFSQNGGHKPSLVMWTCWRALLLSLRYRSLQFFGVLLRDFRTR